MPEPSSPLPHARAPDRRLWSIDLNAVTVVDADGNELPVDHSEGELHGPLVVHLASSPGVRAEGEPNCRTCKKAYPCGDSATCRRDLMAEGYREFVAEERDEEALRAAGSEEENR